jgi:hypothetical protein
MVVEYESIHGKPNIVPEKEKSRKRVTFAWEYMFEILP